MVSSETGGGLVDCSVGSIVWVRRRNGSWWPGKILGPEGLSSSLITSPRSGTPVKLLGREDASVDWYNLEKSKRVKSFRCGDFDECIERAEAAQGMPPKKREKYARREDAILHALELERQMLDRQGKLGYSSNGAKSPDAVTSGKYLEQVGENPRSDMPSLSERLLGSSSLVAAEKNATEVENLLHEETTRGIAIEGSSQVSGDDDDDSLLPSRMRGLRDLGLYTTPQQQIVSGGDELLSGVAFRSKRSRYAYLLQYDSGGDSSNDNRVQPSYSMIQTTPASSKFGGSGYVANVVGEDHISGSTEEEDTETDCSETDSLESEDSDDEMIGLSDDSASIELRPKYPRVIEKQKEHGSYISSSLDGVDGYTSADDDTSHPYPYDHPTSSIIGDGEVSKWKLKGKRNNRILGKRRSPMDIGDAAAAAHISSSRRYIHGNSNWRSGSGFIRADLVNNNKRTSSRTHCVSRQGGSSKYEDYVDVEEEEGLTWNNNNNQPAAIRRRKRREYYWEEEEEEEEEDISGGRMMMMMMMQLVDVDLNVEANNYCKNVPMTSLTSMLNGHSIIGHPIQIEALESGSTDKILKAAGYLSPELGPVWRTGRRTANTRFPRPRFVDKNKLGVVGFSPNPKSKKITTTPPSSNQKIRTLSSIASQRKHHLANGNSQVLVDGLMMKTTVPTAAVACIPVKLVFSRLHEEIGIGRRHQ